MKKLFFVVCLFFSIVCLPVLSSDRTSNGFVVKAGHTTSGHWCECGSSGCICDPGEVPPTGGGNFAAPSDESESALNQNATSSKSGADPGSVALGIFMMLLLAYRINL